MVESFEVQGHAAWLKQYGDSRRVFRLGALARVTRWLALAPLRPPPRYTREQAKQVEIRRLQELRALGVRVPATLGEGEHSLMLSDIGPTLSSQLRKLKNDPAALDALTGRALQAIADAHRRGGYFGQPLPRNMTLSDDGIGFLDFEEDPLEVMTLAQAQARDWLMFAYGVARYYDGRREALAALLRQAMRDDPPTVSRHARQVGYRLHWLVRFSCRLGRSARALGNAIFAIRSATSMLLVFTVLMMDWVSDGDLDLLRLLAEGVG